MENTPSQPEQQIHIARSFEHGIRHARNRRSTRWSRGQSWRQTQLTKVSSSLRHNSLSDILLPPTCDHSDMAQIPGTTIYMLHGLITKHRIRGYSKQKGSTNLGILRNCPPRTHLRSRRFFERSVPSTTLLLHRRIRQVHKPVP